MADETEYQKGLDGRCETMKIKHKDGFAIINASDFDPSKGHEKWEEPKAKMEEPKAKMEEPKAKK